MLRFKASLITLILIVTLIFTGCNGTPDPGADASADLSDEANIFSGDLTDGSRWFVAEVLEVSGSNITVMPLGDGFEASSAIGAGLIVHATADVKSKDLVKVTYNGLIAESYPPQIFSVFSVDVLRTYGSEQNGVYLTLYRDSTDGNYPSIELTWHNFTRDNIEYGEWYTVERFESGEWTDTSIGEAAFDDIAYTVLPGGTSFRSYPFGYSHKVDGEGKYRIKTKYRFSTDNVGEYHEIYFEFEIQ